MIQVRKSLLIREMKVFREHKDYLLKTQHKFMSILVQTKLTPNVSTSFSERSSFPANKIEYQKDN